MSDQIKVVMTDRPDGPDNNSVLKTPSGEANVRVETLSLFAQAAIRAIRTYFQTVLGLLGSAGFVAAVSVAVNFVVVTAYAVEAPIPQIPPAQFGVLLWGILGASIGPAVATFLWNVVEILGKIDTSFPTFRA